MTELTGTFLKYVLTATGAFSPNEHEWKVVFSCGSKSATFTKKNVEGGAYHLSCDQKGMGMKPRSDGSWVFLLDTTFFGPGRIVAVLYADIPDTDFAPNADFADLPGVRRELKRFSLISVVDS